jgi:hypothetical protein
MAMSFGGDQAVRASGGTKIEPIPDACIPQDGPAASPIVVPPDCPKPLPPDQFDGMPEVEVFDRTGVGAWHRLPHFQMGQVYDLANPARYVDPNTGALLVRLVNDRQDQVNAFLGMSIQGSVK